MKSITVSLDSIEKVKEFVNMINTFDGDFDLVSERYVIDAKSIMGIFSRDISKTLRLDIHYNVPEPEKVAETLSKFKVD